MKKYLYLIAAVIFIASADISYAQQLSDEVPEYFLRRYLSEEEMNMPFVPETREVANVPAGPVRMVAEFEPMQAVLIRYQLGLPYSLIAAMSQEIEVITIVSSNSQANTVLNLFNNNGVNTANCSFLIANSNSYWTRDYGPWFVFDGNNEPGIVDFPYNRPRPADNAIPGHMANYLGINYFHMNLVNAGGNLMVDGLGTAAATDLVYEENTNLSIPQIHQMMEDYLGVTDFDVTIDPLGDYIKHIDTWGKYLAPDKILIGQVAPSDPRFNDFENVAAYFANRITPWGYPYKVYRVYTPGGNPSTPYTNSVILNNRVFVPLSGSMWDSQAIASYQQAMPGYQIIGIPWGSWANTDALHCRTREIADLGMLFVDHRPHFSQLEWQDSIAVSTTIIPYSGQVLYNDSLFVYYSVNGGEYQQSPLVADGNTYTGFIKNYQSGDTLYYYLYAADASGRNIKHPYMGHHDPHWFVMGEQVYTDIMVTPDTLYFDNSTREHFDVYNPTTDAVVIYEITNLTEFAAVHIMPLDLPYTLQPGENFEVELELIQPVTTWVNPDPEYFVEIISIETSLGEKQVVVMINKDLITALNSVGQAEILQVYPNPFERDLVFELNIETDDFVSIEVYNMLGVKVATVFEGRLTTGAHRFQWNGIGNTGLQAGTGIYLFRVSTSAKTSAGKIIKH
jgi:agmatine/peptidylarginine deiminase